MTRLFLLFTLVPVLELWLLIEIGSRVGPLPTVALVFLTGVVGAWLARREGLRTLRTFQAALARGIMPGTQIIDGFMILVGGAFLVTPGVMTDAAGFVLLLGPSRAVIKRWIIRWLERWVAHQATIVTSTTPLEGQGPMVGEEPEGGLAASDPPQDPPTEGS